MTEADLLAEFDDVTPALLGSVIYVLMLDEVPQYVGRSAKLIARMVRHRARGRIAFNRILVRSVPKEFASEAEADLIRTLRPALNIASTPRAKRRTRAEIQAEATAILIAIGLKKAPPLIRRALSP